MSSAALPNSRFFTIARWVLHLILGLAFIAAAAAKLLGAQQMVDIFNQVGFGQLLRYVVGLIELTDGVLVLWPGRTIYGALLLTVTMIGALGTHFLLIGSLAACGSSANTRCVNRDVEPPSVALVRLRLPYMETGIDSFVWALSDDGKPIDPSDRLALLLEEVEAADLAGLDTFGIGEHHRHEFLDSAPAIILAAAAARTTNVRLQSSVTVLGAADPVRVFQDFATIDLISHGRAEIVVGRGSSVEAFPLYGRDLRDYDAIFEENLELLLQLRKDPHPYWAGSFRPPLKGSGVYPRPVQESIPVWLGVGGTPASFIRAGRLGLPLMVAIIGGNPKAFRPLIDLYRSEYRAAGHPPSGERVGVHLIGFVSRSDEMAKNVFFPGWYSMISRLGPERGWPVPTRAQFDSLCGERGAYLIGGPETVASKIKTLTTDLGGLDRVSLQMSSASNNHDNMLESINLLGSRVMELLL